MLYNVEGEMVGDTKDGKKKKKGGQWTVDGSTRDVGDTVQKMERRYEGEKKKVDDLEA